MKIDRSKLKKSSSEVPADCKALIERLTACGSNKDEFLRELKKIETWTYGKCELYHWIDVLDICDEVLEMAAAPNPANAGPWVLSCDTSSVDSPSQVSANVAARLKELLLWTLHFTTLLIEHSFSRHLYSSMEHLTMLLASSDLDVVLAVLNLLYMFSKRSNFITRLAPEKRQGLLSRLTHLAASWGGKENGFGLAKCCSNDPIYTFPESATTLHFEFYAEAQSTPSSQSGAKSANKSVAPSTVTVIHMENVDKRGESPAKIMGQILRDYDVPKEKQMLLFTYLRLAASFSDYSKRLKCVQARLQALSVLIYSNQLTENVQSLLYPGLLEELVEVLEKQGDHLMEIKAAALKALTSIIHLDRNPNFPKLNTIIDVTGAASYHGFLPVLVRNCIASLTAAKKEVSPFPQPLATALFSFLYHLASYEAGGEALVSCGMLESLLKVIKWPSTELDHITFVTRAVRVIDLITNLDMQSFQTHAGLSCFIQRLELEVEHCRKQQPFEIRAGQRKDSLNEAMEHQAEIEAQEKSIGGEKMEVDDPQPGPSTKREESEEPLSAPIPGVTCLPQRAALLKSMLNFLKKAIPDPAFSDSIRHVMDGSLPSSLKHIISNAEYYGPSLFLLATDVVTAYVFQEPSLLSSLQDKGLTDVVLHALLVKDVPATREVLGSLPNVFSALCLNARGLEAFVACKPFERLFKVLLSPDYLPAMRRRRSSDPVGDTASNLGNAMDELMRHQPSLKQAATSAIIKLLEEVCVLGRDPKYVCWKGAGNAGTKGDQQQPSATVQSGGGTSGNDAGSSDEEDDDEEEQNSNQAQENSNQAENVSPSVAPSEKEPVPLVDYIHNVMKFVDAILSNNSTDDHCREFVQQKGLVPLMGILGLPNLPIDFPTHQACQAVAAVAKSILTLAHESKVLLEGLSNLNTVLNDLEPLYQPLEPPGGSVLLRELASAPVISEATTNPQATPLLHKMSSAHAYIQMFVHVCRTGQQDIRSMSVNLWGSELGLSVLKGLSRLYTSLVWESTILLALCSDDTLPPGCEFGKADMDKLLPPNLANLGSNSNGAGTTLAASGNADGKQSNALETEETFSPASGTSADSNASVTAAMENLSTDTDIMGMEVDGNGCGSGSGQDKKEKSNPALHYQIKQIKPLLSGASRLGRALAELFALLVKLCVGSPLRQRRGQPIPPTPAAPSPPAKAVASALTKLLASGLSWEPPPTSPIPRFRLTFFICSVGFTAPMLFDEKKYPYHLMLMKFISSGGQKAFFDTFYWTLSGGGSSGLDEGLDNPSLIEGTGEFLDSWLPLLEKMVNPKMVMESPHTMPAKPNGKPYFDATKYLARTHKLAFHAVMKLWGKKTNKLYGPRMMESVLAILCHILEGEKLIAEKQDASESIPAGNTIVRSSGASSASGGGPAASSRDNLAPAAGAAESDENEVNQEWLQTLMDMGFPRERCVEAIQITGSLDQATDFLLSHPFPNVAGRGLGSGSASIGDQDELMRAIALSLGTPGEPNGSATEGSGAQATKTEEQEDEELYEKEDFSPLDRSVIDDFTRNALSGCLYLLDSLPNTVYRVCDLLLALFNRNGEKFKEELLTQLIHEVSRTVIALKEKLRNRSSNDSLEFLVNSTESVQASTRLHLYTLLFEDCKLLCAKIVNDCSVITEMTELLVLMLEAMTGLKDSESGSKIETPRWLTPMLLFIDLHEKVILGMNRRAKLAKICSHTWMWFDISSGKWCSYMPANNKVIDDAFWAGETSVKVQNGRRKYTIQFGTMMQANEDTGNRRPVMISLLNPSQNENERNEAEEESSTKFDGSPMEASAPSGEPSKGNSDKLNLLSLPLLKGLSESEQQSLLQSCVQLVGLPVDPDALNAVLRLCLRLTQDFEKAVLFTQLGGIKALLGLSQSSNFSGFMSLTTLLIRHVMEDPPALRHAMEKVVRASTMNSNSANTKELHYLLRMLAPAACRAPDIFAEVSREVFRVDFALLNKRNLDLVKDQRLLIKSLPQKTNATASPPLQDVSQTVITDLLNFLVTPEHTESSESGETDASNPQSGFEIEVSVSGEGSGWSNSLPVDIQVSQGSTPATNRTQGLISNRNIVRNASAGEISVPLTDLVIPSASSSVLDGGSSTSLSTKESSNKDEKKEEKSKVTGESLAKSKPLLTKSAICRILAELVKSYGGCAKLITDHVYEAGSSELIKEETSALAYLLDDLLINKTDKDLGQLVKTLVAALASCNQHPDAQTTLVLEVKGALSRALTLPESNIKHSKIQAITSLVSTMIESCPPASQNQQNSMSSFKQHQQSSMNNIVKIMLKRGVISDLAKVPHSLDLSSPHISASINAILKPLEILTRTINQPTPIPPSKGSGSSKKTEGQNENQAENNAHDQSTPVSNVVNTAGTGNGGGGTNTTNSEATHAQGDESVDPDPEATEHDVSTATADPNSESALQTGEDGNEDFDEMMDHLLERDSGQEPPILGDVIEQHSSLLMEGDDEHHDSQMMTQNESQFEQQLSQDDEERESEVLSEAPTEENEDMEEEQNEEDGEEDEDDDDEDDDDEEDGDEDGDSPFGEQDDLEDFDDAIYRFPIIDDHDDADLIFQYPDMDEIHQVFESDRASRANMMPLWSEMSGGGMMSDAIASGSGSGGLGGGNHVTPSHPMLMGRQPGGVETSSSSTGRSGSRALQRHRGGIRIHLNSRMQGNPSAPAILQNFLGNHQDFFQQGSRRNGGSNLFDVGFAILDQLADGDGQDIDNGGFFGNGRAVLSAVPSALVRWNEESRVIDGDSVHDCVTALKPSILEVVEKDRKEQLEEKMAERKKMLEEVDVLKKNDVKGESSEKPDEARAEEAQNTTSTATLSTSNSAPSDQPVYYENLPSVSVTTDDQDMVTSPQPTTATTGASEIDSQTTPAQLAEDLASAMSAVVSNSTIDPDPSAVGESTSNLTSGNSSNDNPSSADPLPAALAPLSPSPDEARSAARDAEEAMEEDVEMTDVGSFGSRQTEQQEDSTNGGAESFDPISAASTSTPTADVNEPVAGTSTGGATRNNTNEGPDYSAILGMDVNELPEGVDPSFLAALPEDMRQEVIEEQRRIQTIRQRAAQQQTNDGVQEVSPEFLAALPPNIQEEVLAQQRMEQQRQQASNSNPEVPIDPGEFLQNLPAQLRQTVLADLDDSQVPALPAELAAEAQSLRREYDLRNHRAMMHDRFFSHVNQGSTLSSILRNTVGRLGNQYQIIGGFDNLRRGDGWRLARGAGNRYAASMLASANLRFKGRQMLDQEGLSCLLVLLFIDDSKINTTRLHKILKNLCYHPPTREWVVCSLLSILAKANEGVANKPSYNDHNPALAIGFDTPPAKIRKSTSKLSSMANDGSHTERPPSWLNISMDAALGFRANVFQVHRASGGKRSSFGGSSEKSSSVSIHPGASNLVCRHTLEVLISLARSFPGHFLPWKQTEEKQQTKEKDKEEERKAPKNSSKSDKKNANEANTGDFWDTILKLDMQSTTSKKGKSMLRSHSNMSSLKNDDGESESNFNSSAFGQLLSMLSSPVVRRNSVLTDKLLRLLSLISVGQSDNLRRNDTKDSDKKTEKPAVHETIGSDHLKLAVEVLTSKSCSEEGLEDVNALLLNLSYGTELTRDTILHLLLQGAQELGNVVRQNVLDLQRELRQLKQHQGPEKSSERGSDETDNSDIMRQSGNKGGELVDRFTKEKVVLNAPSKVKGGSELQLPSMNALTNKTSSQAFFLRVLKVIIQLREAALMAMKKSKTSVPKNSEESQDQKKDQEEMDVDSDKKDKGEKSKKSQEEEKRLDSLSEQLRLEALWEALSSCLKDLADTPDHHAVLVLQASVEAFFLVHSAATQLEDKKKATHRETRQEQLSHINEQLEAPVIDSNGRLEPASKLETQTSSSSATSATTSSTASSNLSRDTEKFLHFAETHRTVLNQILRQSTTHLADGPFSVLVDHTRVLDFDIKRRYFRTELERMDEGMRREDLAVHVRRENVFEDSFRELHRRTPEEWKNRFYIVFEGEEGQDAGGLLREWYVIISREIFNPMYALFKVSPGDKVTYMIYEQSQTNPNHLDYFKFVGRVIAKAIYDNKLLECYFTRSFYKHILGKLVKYTDMESEDYTFYKGLEFLMENHVEDLGYDLTFSTEIREFGHTEIRELIPNGSNIKVTEDTKLHYVRLVCQMKMTGAIRKQLSAFLEGFYSIIPKRLISIFNEQELELLLAGLPDIDVDDLKANTEYHKYQANSLQIVWFWRALRSFDKTDKAKFLQFVTGSSKVPLQGFGTLEGMNGPQKFQIHRDDRSTDRLPSAHTCFNQLDLPAYETYDKLRTYLLKAVQECSEGFGFA